MSSESESSPSDFESASRASSDCVVDLASLEECVRAQCAPNSAAAFLADAARGRQSPPLTMAAWQDLWMPVLQALRDSVINDMRPSVVIGQQVYQPSAEERAARYFQFLLNLLHLLQTQ